MVNIISFFLIVISVILLVVIATRLSTKLDYEPPFYVKYDSDAYVLEKAHGDEDACYDVIVPHDTEVFYGTGKISTGIHLGIPKGYVGIVCPRSGNSLKGIPCDIVSSEGSVRENARIAGNVLHGYIDPGYTGDISIIYNIDYCNYGEEKCIIRKGTKIAQILFLRTAADRLCEVNDLTDTLRGSNGFGSTGV